MPLSHAKKCALFRRVDVNSGICVISRSGVSLQNKNFYNHVAIFNSSFSVNYGVHAKLFLPIVFLGIQSSPLVFETHTLISLALIFVFLALFSNSFVVCEVAAMYSRGRSVSLNMMNGLNNELIINRKTEWRASCTKLLPLTFSNC